MSKAPTMSRSRSQLSNSYAPSAFFTFEGGTGACIAAPSAQSMYEEAVITETTKRQILQRINEIARFWFQRAFQCRDNEPAQVGTIRGEMCIDSLLLNRETRAQSRDVPEHKLLFVNALHMSYLPAPLAFKCESCGFFRKATSVQEAANQIAEFRRDACPHPKRHATCDWRQLDVVHVHWSGNHAAPSPDRFDWDSTQRKVYRRVTRCIQCEKSDFLLNDKSPYLSEWHFICAHCNTAQPEWRQNEEETVALLGDAFPTSPKEAAMSLTSYRASVAFYSQSEQFIIFGKGHEESLRMLEEERRPELEEWIAQHFAFSEPPASNQWILDELDRNGHVDRANRLRRKLARLEHWSQNGAEQAEVDDLHEDIREFRESVFSGPTPILRAPHSIPAAVASLLHRTDVNSRFDPIRLALEHDVMKASTLDCAPDAYGRRRFVPFNQMDSDIRPSDDTDEVNRIEAQTSALMQRLRIGRFGLIREFELCRFTYGFTRMASTPTLEAHQRQMPVRLNLFPKIHNRNGDPVHPIYVLTQANEALYVQLDPEAVYAWLQRVGATQGIEWSAGDRKPLSAHLLERARVFPRFVDNVAADVPSPYVYAFTLLHTLAHGFMKAISTVSGLELGSMSEYLFPTDLAFVVYRSGTTMDLGNLSSLWRNENTRFLSTMLEPRTWMCNSGTLCGEKGAACPDCILVPETSCIAQNRLLSRAVVGGGRAPLEDVRDTLISGFLE